MEKLFVCQVCGHLEFGQAPDNCPVCFATKDKFNEDQDVIHAAEKEGKEKHVPVVLLTESCGLIPGECSDVNIKVGALPHPMQSDHWIQWIDVYLDKNYVSRTMLTPDSLQAATGIHFKKDQRGTLTVIELCNKHGYWSVEAQLK